jgi:hypothetical protein
VLVALFLWRPNPMLIPIGVLAAPQVWKALTYWADSDEERRYYAVPAAVKWEYAIWYIVLTAFLAVMTHELHEMLRASAAVREAG